MELTCGVESEYVGENYGRPFEEIFLRRLKHIVNKEILKKLQIYSKPEGRNRSAEVSPKPANTRIPQDDLQILSAASRVQFEVKRTFRRRSGG